MPRTSAKPVLPVIGTISNRLLYAVGRVVPDLNRAGAKRGKRDAAKPSLASVARECHIDPALLSRVLNNEESPNKIRVDQYARLSTRLGVRLEWLILDIEPMEAKDVEQGPPVGVLVDGKAKSKASN